MVRGFSTLVLVASWTVGSGFFWASKSVPTQEAPCAHNAQPDRLCAKDIYKCTDNPKVREQCQLTCGECSRHELPAPAPKRLMDAFGADAHHFLQRCFIAHDSWGSYTKVHRKRFMETFRMSSRYVAKASRVLHLGDGQGYMPLLFHKYLERTNQSAVDGAPSLIRYKDSPGTQGTCKLQQRFRKPGDPPFNLEAKQASIGWDYTMAAGELDVDMGQPWPGIQPASFDVAISLEVMEHMTHGPMHFMLNAARALKNGGYLIITTPNGISFANMERMMRQKNPLSYDYFRCEAVGPAESRPNKERDLNCSIHIGHTKEYTPSELHDAFVNAGFAVVEQTTFSPYGFKLTKLQSLQLPKQFFDEAAQRGEVHFVVGKKLGCHSTARPCHKGFLNYPRSTLYDYNEVLLEGDPLWS